MAAFGGQREHRVRDIRDRLTAAKSIPDRGQRFAHLVGARRLREQRPRFVGHDGRARPLLQRFVKERKQGERFGDFANRAILKETAAPMPV